MAVCTFSELKHRLHPRHTHKTGANAPQGLSQNITRHREETYRNLQRNVAKRFRIYPISLKSLRLTWRLGEAAGVKGEARVSASDGAGLLQPALQRLQLPVQECHFLPGPLHFGARVREAALEDVADLAHGCSQEGLHHRAQLGVKGAAGVLPHPGP